MTEKEKTVILQELWTLIAQDAEATKHLLKISSRQLKCIIREEGDEMTPNKHKIVEELKLQFNFVKTIHEDLVKIAKKLGKEEIVPVIPKIIICDELWDTENGGVNSTICNVGEEISDFQTALEDVIFTLQEELE
jgi:hypothetical protein